MMEAGIVFKDRSSFRTFRNFSDNQEGFGPGFGMSDD
jgi:hypothetical protein